MKSTSACKTNLLNNDNVILRMGGFHIAQTFFGAIEHLMQGTGIVDKEGILCNAAWSYYDANIYVYIIKQSYSNVGRRHEIHSELPASWK